MHLLIAVTAISVIGLALTVLSAWLARRRGVPDRTEQRRRLRAGTAPGTGVLGYTALALACVIGAVVLLARGDSMGAGWFAPAAFFALSAVAAQRHGRWLRARLGEDTARFHRSRQLAITISAMGIWGSLASSLIVNVFGDGSALQVAIPCLVVSAIGLVAVLAIDVLRWLDTQDIAR